GSFKLRGALAKLAALGDRSAAGVVTGSAGNHAQAVAYAARARDLPCEVFMPESAPIAKIEAARELGARVEMIGSTVDDALEAARERAAQDERVAFVHPFEDPEVVAGEGTLGLGRVGQVVGLARGVVAAWGRRL